MFYSDDSTEKKIFQNFFENRDELTKFKELLTDSFPQSVTVIDSTTQKTLFANNAFMTTFNNYSGEQSPAMVETGALSTRQMNSRRNTTDPTENYLKHLHIDLNTLRDLETLRSDFDTFMSKNSNNFITLEELLNKLVQHNLLNYSIMSMAASCSDPGKSRTFDVVLKKIKWDRVDAIAIILNDITYQESLIALKLANASKDKLIATVSHELRTPLHGIIGLLEISQTKVQDTEVRHHLSLCKDNAMLLHSLVNSMLDLQQLSTGKLRLNIGKVNMKKVLNDVVQLFKFQCSEKKIELKVVVSENVPECITSDENRLKQILINLIGNAIKFTFKGGITIEADQDPEDPKQLEVSVSDTGIGIRDDDKPKLFKMYGKLDDAEGVNKNGIGLGLTISSTLASLLNGRSSDKGIELASKLGEGSKFSFKVHKDLESLKSVSSDQNLDRLAGGKKGDREKGERKNSSAMDLIHEHKLENSVTCGEINEEDTGSMVRLEEKLASYSNFPQKETLRDIKRKSTYSRQSPSRIDHFSIAIDDKSIMTTSAIAKRPSFSKQPSQEPLNQSGTEPNVNEKMDINNHTFLKLKSLNENECILVVDDNPFNLLVAKNLIKELGYVVKAATGGHEAIEMVKTSLKDGETIKVIFMDCQMPIMDGFETTRSLKKMMENDEIPVIPILAWTANNGEEDVRRCYESGMSGYLMKPTTQAAILKAISQ
jgi:signal transduction histidine kinase/CheY-like chemotaxis protein